MTGPIENHREPHCRPDFRTLDRSVTRLTDIMALQRGDAALRDGPEFELRKVSELFG